MFVTNFLIVTKNSFMKNVKELSENWKYLWQSVRPTLFACS